MWEYRGQKRPPFAKSPLPGQESVWDYPRPPAVLPDERSIEVRLWDLVVASTTSAFRVLETASPPIFYVPPADVDWSHLVRIGETSICEWKGKATYWGLAGSSGQEAVGWSYEQPREAYAAIGGFVAFYPGMLECFVDGERARPQAGGIYGGWVTDEIVGPMKGSPGTADW